MGAVVPEVEEAVRPPSVVALIRADAYLTHQISPLAPFMELYKLQLSLFFLCLKTLVVSPIRLLLLAVCLRLVHTGNILNMMLTISLIIVNKELCYLVLLQ